MNQRERIHRLSGGSKMPRWGLVAIIGGLAWAGLAMQQPSTGSDQPNPQKKPDNTQHGESSTITPEAALQGRWEAPAKNTTATPPVTTGSSEKANLAEQNTPSEQEQSVQVDPAERYGRWVLLPAGIAILLAIITRQVVPSLLVAIVCGAFMVLPCASAEMVKPGQGTVVGGLRLAIEHYILGAIHEAPSPEYQHIKIIVFTLIIGFVVGVIGRNGGTAGIVGLIAGRTESPRRGALTAWLAGIIVFFDDYANTMIVGPMMRAAFDRLKISRAKLAYIVDSTAAPVSSIALIGTWVGAEIGYIQDGLNKVAAAGAPVLNENGGPMGGMEAFVQSIPYRFYPILAIFLVFLIAITGRDFGPMKKAERRAAAGNDPSMRGETDPDTQSTAKPNWWLGLLPIAILIVGTIWVLVATGFANPDTIAAQHQVGASGENLWLLRPWWDRASTIAGNGDTYLAIFYGSFAAAVLAVFLTLLARSCSSREALEAGMDGLARMTPAIVILVLAWALSSLMGDLKVGDVVSKQLMDSHFEPRWLPAAVFFTAALISFATGTSWGTMGILCPITVQIAANMIVLVEPTRALPLFYASVGAVLAGAVFGDHCSPISDTTVLSSTASGCRHEDHVWTQLPYALITTVASLALGDVLCSAYHQPWYYGLGAGALFLTLWIFIVGRKVRTEPTTRPDEPRSAPVIG